MKTSRRYACDVQAALIQQCLEKRPFLEQVNHREYGSGGCGGWYGCFYITLLLGGWCYATVRAGIDICYRGLAAC